MRKVILTDMENQKYKIIKKLVETNGNKKRAAIRLNCSMRSINRWLRDENVISPKARRKTRKQMKKMLKMKLKEESSEKKKNAIKENIIEISEAEAHPRRPNGTSLSASGRSFYFSYFFSICFNPLATFSLRYKGFSTEAIPPY